jgi:WD40 repeat protein
MTKPSSASMLTTKDRAVTRLMLSKDKKYIYEANSDGTVVKLNAKTLAVILTFKGHAKAVHGLSESPNGLFLATGSNGGIIKLWNTRTGVLVRTFSGYTGKIGSIRFINDAQLVSASADETLKVWSIKTGKPDRAAMLGHTAAVWFVDYDDVSGLLISAGYDNVVRIWDLNKGTQIRSFTDLASPESVAFDRTSLRVVYQNTDKEILIRSIKNGELYGRFSVNGNVTASALFPDGKVVMLASQNEMSVYEVTTGKKLKSLVNELPIGITSILMTDGGRVAIIIRNTKAEWWNVGWFQFQVAHGW